MEVVVVAALNEPTVFPTHLPNPLRVAVVTSGLAAGKSEPQASEYDYGSDRMPLLSEFRDMVLANYEKKYLTDLMGRTPTVKSACSMSGLSRSRLYALLKKYGLYGR